jgi:hypothetical protein
MVRRVGTLQTIKSSLSKFLTSDIYRMRYSRCQELIEKREPFHRLRTLQQSEGSEEDDNDHRSPIERTLRYL